jgi:hypothetical protein
MPRRQVIARIQELVRGLRYEVTDHAWEEMAEDGLLLVDVETAILTGEIVRTDKGDPRGTVYVVEGTAADRQTRVGVALRFNRPENLLIITSYTIYE